METIFEPEIEGFKIREIKEKLIELNSKKIKKSIWYLSRQKELYDKRDKYIDKFVTYFIILGVIFLYGKELIPWVIPVLSLFFAFVEYQTNKYSMSAKLDFCLHLLKEMQTEKDD